MNTAPEIWFPNLGIQIDKLSNVAFSIFGLNVYWYGVIIGTGVIISVLLAFNEAKRTGQNVDDYIDFFLIAVIFCIIGARLYYVIFMWDEFSGNILKIFNLRAGGLAIYGAVITGFLTAIIFTKRRKMNFWVFADTAIPSLSLGQAIGRWGNFFNREAFGGYTDGLFAMRYLKDQVKPWEIPQSVIDNLVVLENGVQYIQVHPTFLYESLWNICLFAIMFLMQRNKKFDGQVFVTYLFGYGIGRFWIESLRTDQLLIGSTGIAVSQVVSAVLVISAVVLTIYIINRQKHNV